MAQKTESAVKQIHSFPYQAASDALTAELLVAVKARAKRKGIPLPKSDTAIINKPLRIDSLTVVELLSCLDPLLPFKVTESVVKAGGYESIATAISMVLAAVKTKWSEHFSGVTHEPAEAN